MRFFANFLVETSFRFILWATVVVSELPLMCFHAHLNPLQNNILCERYDSGCPRCLLQHPLFGLITCFFRLLISDAIRAIRIRLDYEYSRKIHIVTISSEREGVRFQTWGYTSSSVGFLKNAYSVHWRLRCGSDNIHDDYEWKVYGVKFSSYLDELSM